MKQIDIACDYSEYADNAEKAHSNMDAGTLQGLVAAAASSHSHRAAVTFDCGSLSDSPVSLLYGDLFELAVELSHILRKNCTPDNGLIGLCCCDDLFIPVWILG